MIQRMEFITKVFQSQSGQRLDQALTKMLPEYSRSHIKKLILDQHILINGKILNKPKKRIFGGEIITINAKIKEKMHFEAQDIPLNIVYEDDDIIIINKPHGLVMHPGTGNLNGTMLNALLHYHPPIAKIPRAGIIHRLDKNTTGLIVVAKTLLAQKRLIESLQLRKITREYKAIVIGYIIEDGIINKPISRHPINRTRMCVRYMGKPAVTYYSIIERFRFHTYLHLRLETGRTHQIRVHMAHITHPLVGDKMYGNNFIHSSKKLSETLARMLYKFNRHALHAAMLRLYHPITNIKMEWYAPIPQDMVDLIEAMRTDSKEYIDKY